MAIPAFGTGITYTADLEEFILQHAALFQVVEVEPQTLWIEDRKNGRGFRVPDKVFEKLLLLPGQKLVHSVGAPVGGSVKPDQRQFGLLKEVIRTLRSPYASEHLSFNCTHGFNTGFFLPPRQTSNGVQKAVDSICYLRDAIEVPLAVETGVNYFRPRSDEMRDGEFVAAVTEQADCGILLDLHNLFANQLNGRQSIAEFIDEIPLDRVWEVHLAGGFEMDGYYLDSHSGEIPPLLFDLAKGVIARLPNLKAIVFEIFPSFLPVTGTDLLHTEMKRLQELWQIRGSAKKVPLTERNFLPAIKESPSAVQPDEWEHTIGKLAIGRAVQDANGLTDTINDPAVPLIQKLIHEFRASMLVAVLPLTSRLIMLSISIDGFMTVVNDFWSKHSPELYAASEACNFIDYLEALQMKIPSLQAVLSFEKTVLHTLLDDQTRVVSFEFNPFPVLQSLSDGKLPEGDAQLGNYEIEITPGFTQEIGGQGNYDFTTSFPFH